MFFDPLGMNASKITYVINPPPAPTPTPLPGGPVPPGPIPPGGGNPPPIAGFPTFQTTGPATAPTQVYTGPMIINQNGTTIENVIVRGCIQVIADNVTIRNSRFEASCSGTPIIWHREGTNLQVLNNELIGLKSATAIPVAGVTCSSCTVQANNVRGTADGFNPNGTAQIIGNYIGQLGGGILDGFATHNDGFQIANGNGVVIRGNTIDTDCGVSRQEAGGQGGCNTAVFFQPFCEGCAIGGATIEGNYFQRWNGPAESVFFLIMVDGSTGVRVLNNTFGNVPGAYCVLRNGGTIVEWTGNRLENNTAVSRNC
jgi:hypothetical protein